MARVDGTYTTFLGVLVVVFIAGTVEAVRAETSAKSELVRALVVTEIEGSKGGVGPVPALRITDPRALLQLESFFPGYREVRSTEFIRLWKAGYFVYFDFRDHSTLRVAVSRNNNAAFWMVGAGDFDTNGDFELFLEQLSGRP